MTVMDVASAEEASRSNAAFVVSRGGAPGSVGPTGTAPASIWPIVDAGGLSAAVVEVTVAVVVVVVVVVEVVDVVDAGTTTVGGRGVVVVVACGALVGAELLAGPTCTVAA